MVSFVIFIIFIMSFLGMGFLALRKIPKLMVLTEAQMAKKNPAKKEVFFDKIKHPQSVPVIKQTLSQAKRVGQTAWRGSAKVVTKFAIHKDRTKASDTPIKDNLKEDDYWDKVKKN